MRQIFSDTGKLSASTMETMASVMMENGIAPYSLNIINMGCTRQGSQLQGTAQRYKTQESNTAQQLHDGQNTKWA